jgi:hypothetical protein
VTDAVRDDPALNRFELKVGGEIAAAYYSRSRSGGLITFTRTGSASSPFRSWDRIRASLRRP